MFPSNWKRKSDHQNGVNEVEREALPIELVLKVIQNQCTTMAEDILVPKKVQKEFSCCFPLQKLIFASTLKRKSDLQNGLNYIEREALPIEVVLQAIQNQCTTMAEDVLVPKKVQKGFSCCFPLQKLIFASNPT